MLTLIHTGDWHIGKTFSGWGERAAVLQKARVDVLDRIALAARQVRARHVLVAGDTFHAATLELPVLRPAMARLASHHDVVWHLIPGNHDPGSAQIWNRVGADGLPANVRLHLSPAPVEIEPGVALLPCPLASRFASGDPTAVLDGLATPAGHLRIGLAHGATLAFGGDGGGRGVIAQDRAARAGLDYLALGDWHGVRQVGPRAWYAGTPEPDGWPDNEPGYVLAVSVPGPGAPVEARRHHVAGFTWRRVPLVLDTSAGLEALEAEIQAAGPAAAQWLLRLELSGRLTPGDDLQAADRLDRLAARLFALDVDRSALSIVETGAAASDALSSPDLAWAAERILASGAASPQANAIAARALRRLAAAAAAVRSEDAA